MGCAGSKQADNVDERRKQNKDVARAAAAPAQTGSRTIAAGGRSAEDDANLAKLGTSATDLRANDEQYFQEILERTAHNFINIPHQSAQFENKDSADRAREYGNLRVPLAHRSLILELPKSEDFSSADDVRAVLSGSSLSGGKARQVFLYKNDVDQSISAVAVQDVGPLIVYLPNIGNSS